MAATGLGVSAGGESVLPEASSAAAGGRTRRRSLPCIGVEFICTASLSEPRHEPRGGLFSSDVARSAGCV